MTTPTLIQQTADFGTMPVVSTDVDDAILATLRTWMNTYLWKTEDERGLGEGFFPRPGAGHYDNALTSMEFLDQTLPSVLVTTAPTEAPPRKLAGGLYTVAWRVVISSIVRGPTKRQTRYNAAHFEGTVRRCVVQQAVRMPGTIVTDVKWLSSNVAPVADTTGAQRYLAAGIGQYSVSVDTALADRGGPLVPDAEPYNDLAVVTSVTENVVGLTPKQPF